MKEKPGLSDREVWDRLRRNRDSNAHFFHEAGARPEMAREIDCPSCGAQENALFWTVKRSAGKRLHLVCPICERGSATYVIHGRRSSRRGTVAAAFAIAILCGSAGMALLIHEAPPPEEDRIRARVVAIAAYETGADVVQRAVAPVVSLLPGMDYEPPPRRERTARAREGAGGSSAAPRARATSAGRRSEPSPPAAASPAASRPSPSETTALARRPLVLVADGDRREELRRAAEELGGEAGAQLLEIVYDPARDRTRVVVAGSSPWLRRLTPVQGWRPAPE